MQLMNREIRHTISYGLYDDIDMVNAFPVILYNLCKKHKLNTPYLLNYINNRNELLGSLCELNQPYKIDTKRTVLSLFFGGISLYNAAKNKPVRNLFLSFPLKNQFFQVLCIFVQQQIPVDGELPFHLLIGNCHCVFLENSGKVVGFMAKQINFFFHFPTNHYLILIILYK